MTTRPLARWAVSIAALGCFSVLAAGSASPGLDAQFEEVARKVEEQERQREAQEELLRNGTPDAAEAAPAPLVHDPAVETAEHGSGTGSVSSKTGSTVVLDFDGTPPKQGTTVQVKIRIVENIFGADVEADLQVGSAKVTAVSAESISMDIIEEKSKMSVNGEDVDHFSGPSDLMLTW